MRVLASCPALAAAVLVGAPASAQPAQPDAIPRELAEVLVAGSGWDDDATVTLVVGRAPDRFPAPLPASAAVLGGVTRGRFVREVVVTSPDAPDAARAAYLRALDVAGWRPLPRGEMFGDGGHGFVASRVIFGPGSRGEIRCGPDDATLHLRTAAGAGGGSRLHVSVSAYPPDSRTSGLCAGSRRDRLGQHMLRSPLPPLQAPLGGTLYPQGSGGSDEDHHATALVTGAASATDAAAVAAVAAHFAGQFAAAGWTAGPPIADDSLHARRVTSPADSAGVRWSGVLWVSPLAGVSCPAPTCRPPFKVAVFVTSSRAARR